MHIKIEDMKNYIINGDSIKVLNSLPEESVDLIFADPPYWMRTNGTLFRANGTKFNGTDDDWDKFNSNEEYLSFTRKWLQACYRVLKKNGSIWVIGGMQCIYAIGGIMQEIGFWFINDVIWEKTNPTPNFKGTRLTNSHETLIWDTKSKNSKYTFNYKTAKELNVDVLNFNKGERRQLGSIWRLPVVGKNERLKDNEGNKLHNTQKPEKMLYRIINISSNIGDLVLDPFGGTMTTGKVAKQTGRNYIMIEKEQKYCEYGQKRIDETKINIGEIEKASFDKKPIKAPLKEMILRNYFFIGEKFYLKDKKDSNVVLNEQCKLTLDNGEIIDIHSGAAILSNLKTPRVNGFNYWFVERNNQKVSINEIRNLYRKDMEKLIEV